jgi:non-ribosomal peptide synthase protein (TIGR01720 family)
LLNKDIALSPHEFASQIREQKITTLFLTTALFNQMAREAPRAFSSLSHLLFGGEAVEPKWVREVIGNGAPQRLLHVYGPTESTTFASWHLVKDVPEDAVTVPIGSPLSNTQLYLLDRNLHPVPIGMVGELYIGGDGLARGYLNRPELTAERFIPHPFSALAGARLYKTGDLARYRPDGEIEFLGRNDDQVKVRGFRIELGEIETTLREHPGVREAVLMAREDAPGERRLTAYLVITGGVLSNLNELRGYLKERLPEYMIPAVFVEIESVPLTPNGKTDYRALLAPDHARPELGQDYVAARTPLETTLIEIWGSVLGTEQIGIHDNFFDLGGDSILGIQITARAGQAGLKISPRLIFECQTIAELAAVAEAGTVNEQEQGTVTGPVPLTPIQQWFFEQNLAEPQHFNQSLILEVREAIDTDLITEVLRELLLHHDVLRLSFRCEEAGWQQTIGEPRESVPFTRINLAGLSEQAQLEAIETEATNQQSGLDLSAGPLLKVVYFDLGARRSGRLLIIIHHLAVDGVSWRILLDDLQTLYDQLSRGEKLRLPPKTTSFKSWARSLTTYAQESAVEQELSCWLAEPRRSSPALPVDYEGQVNSRASEHSFVVALGPSETRALLQEVPSVYHTQINDVLLTALIHTFARWTGENLLLVDLEGHGREEFIPSVDVSRTVGWFTTVFPVLLDLRDTFEPGQLLKSVKQQLAHIPNRGLGYGLLKYLSGKPDIAAELRALAQAEVSFNYLGQFDQVMAGSARFNPASESIGPSQSLIGVRPHLFEITAQIVDGRLSMAWNYSDNIYLPATVESLAMAYLESLQAIIAHCQFVTAPNTIPSSFSDFEWNPADLESISSAISK